MRRKPINPSIVIALLILLVFGGVFGYRSPAFAAEASIPVAETLGIVAYWPLDSFSGSTIQDTVGSHTGSCSGTKCPTATAGKVSGAVTFDATDAVNMLDGPDLSWKNTDSFSIELWVKMGGSCAGMRQVFVGKYRGSLGTRQSWWLGCEVTNRAALNLRDSAGKSLTINGGPPINDGKWHQVVGVRDGTGNQNLLYVDGTLATSQQQTYLGDFIDNQDLNMGYYNVAPYYHFVGSLDEVAIHNRALSPAEISFHYNEGAGRPYSNIAPVAGDDGPIVAVKNMPVTIPAYFLLGNDTDPEGDPVSITSIGPNSTKNGTITGSGPYTYTPPADYTGADSFQYTISDPKGGIDTATVSVNVRASNQAPGLGAINDQSNPEGATVSVQAHATDPEGDLVIYTATDLPDGLKIDLYTGLISGSIAYTASTKSPYLVKVTAYDGGFLPSPIQSFTWTVTDVNGAPELSQPSNQFNNEGDSISVQIQAVDPDGGPLTFTITGLPKGLYYIQTTGLIAGSISYQAFEESSGGTYSVTVTVSDGSQSVTKTFAWIISNATPPKTLLPFLLKNWTVQ